MALFTGSPMRIVAQRVQRASVSVSNVCVSQIDRGLVLLIGFHETDDEKELRFWAEKCLNLRIFEDADGKMNRSVTEVGGSILAISQFTLYGDVRKGRRPSFVEAARPETAEPLYDQFVAALRHGGIPVVTGIFGAFMDVEIHNAGPVTIILER